MSLRFRVLGSGSTGNATLVEGEGVRILIDAGLGPRDLAERLQSVGVDPASVDAIFLSHEHQDHSKGAASFSRKWGVRICGSRGTYAAMGLGAETIAGYDVLEPGVGRAVGALTVRGVPVPHDAAGPYAFVVANGGATLGHATDFGHFPTALLDAFRECDAVLVESNHDPDLLRRSAYPWSLKERILGPRGHVSNAEVARYLARGLGDVCRTLVLAHLSQTNNHPELAEATAVDALRRRGRTEVAVSITNADGTGWIAVGQPPPPGQPGGGKQLRLF
ncbi:MAG: MBL fold metallo-hydrolase [Vicinamibacteria bacterium]